MLPTLEPGERFFMSKRLGALRRGDVIVFQYPPDPTVLYVQRIAAAGGDTVDLSEEGEFIVNGQAPSSVRIGVEQRIDPVIGPQTVERWRETVDGKSYTIYRRAGPYALWAGQQIPAGHFFLMGDNRDKSNDSRTWGTVPLALVKGRALFTWWSTGPAGIRWDRVNKRLN